MNGKIFQLKIELPLEHKRPVWRSIKVDGNSTFRELHLLIQIVMGWENAHFFMFENKTLRISLAPGKQDLFFNKFIEIDADEITLEEVLKRKGSKIKYIYDFGDYWTHWITVEETKKTDVLQNAICLDGEGQCPPEDCGGIPGYLNILSIISDPNHSEYTDCIEWIGEGFDPEYFNLKQINKTLKGNS